MEDAAQSLTANKRSDITRKIGKIGVILEFCMDGGLSGEVRSTWGEGAVLFVGAEEEDHCEYF
ncbi:hypothetical protein ANAEL_00161 [Anaerolineales bacterium]|nr:hypothetical protein ANAEL_00161 [Anaerolineales bacterium]